MDPVTIEKNETLFLAQKTDKTAHHKSWHLLLRMILLFRDDSPFLSAGNSAGRFPCVARPRISAT